MTKIVFLSNRRPPLEVAVAPGERVIDVCDASHAPVPFSCRSTSCSTCCVRVHDGGDLLTEPSDEELDVLDSIGMSAATHRLACSMSVAREGTITLESVDETV